MSWGGCKVYRVKDQNHNLKSQHWFQPMISSVNVVNIMVANIDNIGPDIRWYYTVIYRIGYFKTQHVIAVIYWNRLIFETIMQNKSHISRSRARIQFVANYILKSRAYKCTGGDVESALQIFLKSMKSYNHSNSNYKREKTLKLRSSLYLRLGSLRSGGKWFLFSVDRLNVKLFWKSSP